MTTNKKVFLIVSSSICLLKILIIDCCPQTSSHVLGLYATAKLSAIASSDYNVLIMDIDFLGSHPSQI